MLLNDKSNNTKNEDDEDEDGDDDDNDVDDGDVDDNDDGSGANNGEDEAIIKCKCSKQRLYVGHEAIAQHI